MKSLLFAILFLALISSCSTDIDLIAPYKETMVVYGLLNPDDPAHQYIRISKAYLGEGNTVLMAGQKDSVNFADVLDVKMDRILNNVVVQTFTLTRIDTIPKSEGVFYNPYQVYYVLSQPILTDGSEYRLRVRDTVTNVQCSSLTKVVGKITVTLPSIVTTTADFAQDLRSLVKYSTHGNSKICNASIRFHYSELDTTTGITTQKYTDWTFSDQQIGDESTVEFDYLRVDFYKVIASQVPVNPAVKRRVDNLPAGIKPVEFRMVVGSEDFYTYYLVSQPASGIVQEKPLFTTIQNGLGLFTSRLIHSEFRDLNSNSKAAFDTSAFTRNLNFEF